MGVTHGHLGGVLDNLGCHVRRRLFFPPSVTVKPWTLEENKQGFHKHLNLKSVFFHQYV